MIVRTYSGDDNINSLCMATMHSVAAAMVKEGYISAEQQANFMNDHICQVANSDGGFKQWFLKVFGKDSAVKSLVICSKVQST